MESADLSKGKQTLILWSKQKSCQAMIFIYHLSLLTDEQLWNMSDITEL